MKTTRFRRFGFAFIPSVAMIMAACSSVPEDAGETSSADRIDPTGDETMASLTLQLPTGACLPGGSCARPVREAVFQLDSTAMILGTALRVAPGAHTLRINGTTTTLNLGAGSSRTLVLPVVRRTCTKAAAATIPPVEFGASPSLRYATCPQLGVGSVEIFRDDGSCTTPVIGQARSAAECGILSRSGTQAWGVRLGATCLNIADVSLYEACTGAFSGVYGGTLPIDSDTPVAPGSYPFSVESASGSATTQTRDANEGSFSTWSFDLPLLGTVPTRFAVNVTFASGRDFPNAAATTIQSSSISCGNLYTFPATTTPLTLRAFRFDTCTHALMVPGRSLPLDQTTDNNVRLYRIDMADVSVLREDGTRFTVAGTYEVYFGGTKIAGPFPTKTGVDALAGDYEVVVKYSTALGEQTNRYNVHF